MRIVSDRFSATGAEHSARSVVFATAGAGGPAPALGCNRQAQQTNGSADRPTCFFNDVIIIAGTVVKSPNARVEIMLGYRRIYRNRANVFLQRYAPKLENVFPKSNWENWLEKKRLKKKGLDPSSRPEQPL